MYDSEIASRLFQSMPVGIVVQDADGRIVSANPVAQAILGLTLDQLQGRTSIDPEWRAIHEDGSPFPGEAHPAMETLRTGAPVSGVTMGVYHPVEARTRWLQVSSVPFRQPGEAPGPWAMAVFVDITARVAAEAGLKEVEGRLRLFVEHAPAAIALLDERMNYLAVSRRWLEDYRLAGESVIGRSHYELFPEIPQRWRDIHQRCLAGATERCDRDPFPRQDGTTDWIRWEIRPWRRSDGSIGGILLFSEVITEWVEALETIGAQEEAYRLLFNSSLDAIFFSAPDGRVLDANPAACRMFGWTREEFLEHGRARIVDPSDPRLLAALEVRDRTGQWSGELEMIRRDGSRIPCEMTSTVFQDRQGQPRASIIVRDISERRAAEAQLRESRAQLLHGQKMESLGTLAGGIAHDMNNVLGAILAMASANLQVLPPGSPGHGSFEVIAKAATRGAETVKGLLAFARQTQAGEQVLDVNRLLQDDVQLLRHTARADVAITLDLEPDPLPIRGEASSLALAFMNLFVNSLDAMPAGGTLAIQTRNLGAEWLRVTVADTGTGMTGEVLARAQEPFFTTKEVGRGTGLGLSLVYSTVKAHQGQIEIQSQTGVGTEIRVRFPACARAGAAPDGPPAAPAASRPMRILLVDDDELIRSSLGAMLASLDHAVTASPCGEAALERIEAGFRPERVILDMNMPGLGGSGTLPRLRALLPDVPVLLATGRADQAARDLCAAYPAVTLLPKPFDIQDLQKALDALAGGQG